MTFVTAKSDYRWIDLDVYKWGGMSATDPINLYETGHPTLGMPFTYTPFAALMFSVLGSLRALTPVAWTILCLLALLRSSFLMARERLSAQLQTPPLIVAIGIASMISITQPGTSSIRLGQISFILLWLILEDAYHVNQRFSGILTGLATAIKLTPAAFILLYILLKKKYTALTAMATLCATIILGWTILPTESRYYWRHLGPKVDTIGPVKSAEHWSLNATLHRITEGGNSVIYLFFAVTILSLSLWLARTWWNADNRAAAIGLIGLGAGLASPFSWSHHWVLAMPLFVGLTTAALNEVSRTKYLYIVGLSIAYAFMLTALWWHAPRLLLAPLPNSISEGIAINFYLIPAVVLLAIAWKLRPRLDT